MDLTNPKFYFNRELSWLEFNERVLEEAFDKTNPIMERLKFLAITASNMDEFFMVRVAGLIEQVEAGFNKPDFAGCTPTEQLQKISEKVHQTVIKQYNCLNSSILPKLKKNNMLFLKYQSLSKAQKEFVKKYFKSTVFPVLTPMAIDQSRPFPLLLNKSLNIIVEIEGNLYALVQVPSVIPRIIELPSSECRQFILLEDIILPFIDQLFIGNQVKQASTFRITRNSDLNIDEEEAEDLLIQIEKSIKSRKWGEPVRLEIQENTCPNCFSFLKDKLALDDSDIYIIDGPIDLTMWFNFASLSGCDHLRDEVLKPQPVPAFIDKDIFEAIREKDILVHHPYDSFDCVVNFVRAAATDASVLAIKQTLYRVSGNSPIVSALIQAAENGKQVTVLVELKARFDEENNILWARKLEKAGCHVVYGLVGLKIHCKTCLVVRKEDDCIRRYLHLSTGNYNDKTAKTYTDIGIFTCNSELGTDISTLFNVITGYSENHNWNKISVSPVSLRENFISLIEAEAKIAKEGGNARIIAKMNSIVDAGIIQALYKASIAGVKIYLITRGICCLRSGVKSVSENITVISIVDRFLEHSRIFYFENKQSTKIFLGSADWMPRNLDRRVEVMFPVEDETLKKQLIDILELTLKDNVKARIQQQDGSYVRTEKPGGEAIRTQLIFHSLAEENVKKFNKKDERGVFKPISALNVKERKNDNGL